MQAFKVLNSLKTDLGLLSTWTVELVNNIAVTNLLAFVTPADMDDLRNNPSSIEFLHLFNQDGVVSEKNVRFKIDQNFNLNGLLKYDSPENCVEPH